MKRKLAQF